MLFNSLQFLIFFPIVALMYFLIPHRVRYLWLLVSSYYFYMCWNPKYAVLIFTSTAITYGSGLLIHWANGLKQPAQVLFYKRLWVALSFLANLSILFFFKYFDFALANVNVLLGAFHFELIQPTFDIILPVGISFYTFQALSYTMDVYRGDIYAEKNFAKYALFVSFFPQLVAGPIERSKNLLVQISERHAYDYLRVKNGLLLMLWGFFQKLVIADRGAILVNTVYNQYEQFTGFEIALATMVFALQIYCDFAAYSDIAIGAAQVMGFSLMDNFKQPYFARSIQEFWRRWHISLSTWFRDYLYIPLGGNRVAPWRKHANVMIVFLASGLWHGASWNFVIWGFLHGFYQIFGTLTARWRKKLVLTLHLQPDSLSYRLQQMAITFVLVNFAWIFFRAPTGGDALAIIGQLFAEFNPWIFFDGSIYNLGLNQKDMTVLLLGTALLFFVSLARYNGIKLRDTLAEQNWFFRWGIYLIAIFFILIFGIYGPGFAASQFMYFQF